MRARISLPVQRVAVRALAYRTIGMPDSMNIYRTRNVTVLRRAVNVRS
jgi:hypothetical protein